MENTHICTEVCRYGTRYCPAVWTWWSAKSEPFVISAIHLLTKVDSDGRGYWRKTTADGWQRLQGPDAYSGLNRALAPWR